MKHLLLTLSGILAMSFGANSQLRNLDYVKKSLIPVHIQQQMTEEEEGMMAMSYSMNKNNSYDTPESIAHYSVDLLQIETLEKNYSFTYSPAGELRTMTRMDDVFNLETRWTYNFNSFGQYSSVIREEYSGGNWMYTGRTIFNYTGSGLLESETYEDYVGFNWVYDGGMRLEYVGSGLTPTQIIGSWSNDGIVWEEGVKINYQYAGSTPNFLEIIVYDDNLLHWVEEEKWEINDWGPHQFYADFLFNERSGPRSVTDNLISKRNPLEMYPADFNFHADFNYTTGVYDVEAEVESTYDLGNRTGILVKEFNGTVFDSTFRETLVYDVCYGYRSHLSEDYVSPGVWTITGGTEFLGHTNSYSGSCYVFAYNYFENYSDAEPNGIRTRRYAIVHAASLGLEEEISDELFTIYPNPATIQLNISSDSDDYNCTITSMDGRTMLEMDGVNMNETIDVSNFPSGIYLITVNSSGKRKVKKFIKE